MASLSKCEILIGSSFSVGREFNDVPSKPWKSSATINILLLVRAGDSACFTNTVVTRSSSLFLLLCALDMFYMLWTWNEDSFLKQTHMMYCWSTGVPSVWIMAWLASSRLCVYVLVVGPYNYCISWSDAAATCFWCNHSLVSRPHGRGYKASCTTIWGQENWLQ